ncbi:MAG: hypothetical protein HQK58_12465 [Deltaproteobacteria bacterium]|nr:hypothetical protein [Deltaproteobacteria bacterium]
MAKEEKMPIDLTAEMKKIYENGQDQIKEFTVKIKTIKEQIKGAKAYLLAIGAIDKSKRKGRGRPKGENTEKGENADMAPTE